MKAMRASRKLRYAAVLITGASLGAIEMATANPSEPPERNLTDGVVDSAFETGERSSTPSMETELGDSSMGSPPVATSAAETGPQQPMNSSRRVGSQESRLPAHC